jgi:signal transduction histidine kinase
MAELTQDIVQKYKPLADKNKIDLQPLFPSGLHMVEGDIGMIERAMSNLIDNALNYTPSKGVVKIQLENEEESVSVKVSDTGHGIPPEDLPHIFDRFYRGDKSRTSEGTGLGLAITKKIIEAHKSDVQVESHINRGTSFIFRLHKYPGQSASKL